MWRQTKASGEKSFNHDQLTLRLGDLLRPRNTPHSTKKYPSCCISWTRAEEIRDTPNSTVSPGCSVSTAKSLKVSSDDAAAGGVLAADKEEDDMAMYHRRRRAVCLTRARSSMSRSKEGKRADERFQKEARVLWRAESAPEPRRPALLFIHGTRRFGKPAVNSTACVNCHIKKPRGTISSEGSVSTI
jgi:hypothetical protein